MTTRTAATRGYKYNHQHDTAATKPIRQLRLQQPSTAPSPTDGRIQRRATQGTGYTHQQQVQQGKRNRQRHAHKCCGEFRLIHPGCPPNGGKQIRGQLSHTQGWRLHRPEGTNAKPDATQANNKPNTTAFTLHVCHPRHPAPTVPCALADPLC
jgi:hypothetical protein